jgi:transposase InsO family protein
MKTIVIKRNAYGQGHHKFQEMLWGYAKDMGFIPRLCKPYRAKTKGKVERFIGYLRRSFFNPLAAQFKQCELTLDVQAANVAVYDWLDTVANTRIHSDLQEQPLKLWMKNEKSKLQAIPEYCSAIDESKVMVNRCPPHSTLLPGYDPTFLQHNISIYEHLIINF